MNHSGSFLPPYLSTRTLAFCLSALLLTTAATFSVSAGFEISEVQLLVGVMNEGTIDAVDRYAHGLLRDYLATARVGLVSATALLFGIWLFRSRINCRALGARRFQYSRKWALLGFAIPPLNLIRPLQVVSEVWRASDPATQSPLDWKTVAVPRFLRIWWWMLVGSMGVELLGMALTTTNGVTLFQLTGARGIGAVADLGATIAAVLGYLVVSGISAAQDRKWAILSGTADLPETVLLGDPGIPALL